MRIDVLTLFPKMFAGPMGESIIGKAREKNLLEMNVSNFRDFSDNKHQTVDDYPYGGGAGMLLKVQPIYDNLQAIANDTLETKKRVILLDPAGKPFNQAMAEEFSQEEHLVFICGHYEGYDERIRSLVTDEVSLGDYVLTGGRVRRHGHDRCHRAITAGCLRQQSFRSNRFAFNGIIRASAIHASSFFPRHGRAARFDERKS